MAGRVKPWIHDTPSHMKSCRGCKFAYTDINNWVVCQYLLMTYQKRPCPAGDGCTVREAKKRTHKRPAWGDLVE